jgi:hypothetical protein
MRALSVLFGLSLVLTLAGCPGNENPVPPDAFRPDGGPRDAYVGDTNDLDAFAPPDGGNDTGVDADVDADLPDTGTDAGGPDAFSCTAATGCFQCAPATDHQEQFLNHCTAPGVTCQSFTNDVAHLPHLEADGTLPPLP